jgi:triacylglycerol lipase
MRPGSPFLAALNRQDETPGAARYATWWSPCDEAVQPAASAALDGAENHQTRCLSHLQLLTDSTVYRDVRDFVSGRVILAEDSRAAQALGSLAPR